MPESDSVRDQDTGADGPMPFAAPLEPLASPSVDQVVTAVRAVLHG